MSRSWPSRTHSNSIASDFRAQNLRKPNSTTVAVKHSEELYHKKFSRLHYSMHGVEMVDELGSPSQTLLPGKECIVW